MGQRQSGPAARAVYVLGTHTRAHMSPSATNMGHALHTQSVQQEHGVMASTTCSSTPRRSACLPSSGVLQHTEGQSFFLAPSSHSVVVNFALLRACVVTTTVCTVLCVRACTQLSHARPANQAQKEVPHTEVHGGFCKHCKHSVSVTWLAHARH